MSGRNGGWSVVTVLAVLYFKQNLALLFTIQLLEFETRRKSFTKRWKNCLIDRNHHNQIQIRYPLQRILAVFELQEAISLNQRIELPYLLIDGFEHIQHLLADGIWVGDLENLNQIDYDADHHREILKEHKEFHLCSYFVVAIRVVFLYHVGQTNVREEQP